MTLPVVALTLTLMLLPMPMPTSMPIPMPTSMPMPMLTMAAHVGGQSGAPSGTRAEEKSAASSPADTADRNLRAYTELLRTDLRAQKVMIITQLMAFTEAEDGAFWPIYRQYEVELAAINDERIALIDEYAREYANVTDALADKLARKALELEARRTALTQRYYERIKTALSAKTAARFLQIEHQLQLLLDLQIAATLPIVK